MGVEKLVSAKFVLTISLAVIAVGAGQAMSPVLAQARDTAPVEFKTASQYNQYRVPDGTDQAPVVQGDSLTQPDVQYYEDVARASEQAERQRLAAEQAQQHAQYLEQQRQYQNALLHNQAQADAALAQQAATQAASQAAPINYGQARTQPNYQQDVSQTPNGFSDVYVHQQPQGTQRQVFQGQYVAPEEASQASTSAVSHIYQGQSVKRAGSVLDQNTANSTQNLSISSKSYPTRSNTSLPLPDMSQASAVTMPVATLGAVGAPVVLNGASSTGIGTGYNIVKTSNNLFYNSKTGIPASAPSAEYGQEPLLGDAIEILKGDTLFRISERYRVALRALVETNRLQPPFTLEEGSFIYLPPPNIHVVEAGETLYAISRRYNVDTRSLANMNGLPKPWTIHPNDQILLPSLARDSMASASTAQASANARSMAMQNSSGAPAKQAFSHGLEGTTSGAVVLSSPQILVRDPAKDAVKTQELGRFDETPSVQPIPVNSKIDLPGNSRGFLWPVEGNVLAGFGENPKGLKNDGLNIAAPNGSEIKATADGYVVYAGNELPGFGFLVLINHGDGWVSAYAHAEALLVEEGQAIRQGQTIAKVGHTGSVDTPQLHFQLRKGKAPIDPAQHLSPKRAI